MRGMYVGGLVNYLLIDNKKTIKSRVRTLIN